MQSIPVVVNKHNTARVASCWFIIYYRCAVFCHVISFATFYFYANKWKSIQKAQQQITYFKHILTSLQYAESIRNFHKVWNECYKIRLLPKVIYQLFNNNFLTDYVFSLKIYFKHEKTDCVIDIFGYFMCSENFTVLLLEIIAFLVKLQNKLAREIKLFALYLEVSVSKLGRETECPQQINLYKRYKESYTFITLRPFYGDELYSTERMGNCSQGKNSGIM